ncbi:MAG: transposase [Phycisphaerae bacterium]
MASSEESIIAWHFIFCTYGFWLPNDPRGSWSRFVRSPGILAAGGPATGGGSIRRSVARADHNVAVRLRAKHALYHPPVRLTGLQALAAVRGIEVAVREKRHVVRALAIMPDHVHIVMDVHHLSSAHVVRHLKARATQSMSAAGIHPLAALADDAGRMPSPWARNHWCVFVHSTELAHVIRYVENNPIKAGLKPQRWRFVAANVSTSAFT